jgi:hypothetical protein
LFLSYTFYLAAGLFLLVGGGHTYHFSPLYIRPTHTNEAFRFE